MIKSFCISLEKNKSLWPELRSNFIENGITDITIYPAVNGPEIGNFFNFEKGNSNVSEKTKEIINSLGGIDKIVSTWGLYHLYNKTYRKDHAQLGSWGAVGCALSHMFLWQHIVDENLPMAIIFEDDIEMDPTFKEKLPEILNNIPEDADVVFLDVFMNFKPLQYNDMFDRVMGQFFGLHAYIMTNKGARKLLPQTLPIEIQIDSYIGFRADLKKIKLYTAKGICRQKAHISSIQSTRPCIFCDVNDQDLSFYDFLLKFLVVIFLVFISLIVFSKLFSLFSKKKTAG